MKTQFSTRLKISVFLLSCLGFVACSNDQSDTPDSAAEFEIPTVTVMQIALRSMPESHAASGLLVPREEAAVASETPGFLVDTVLVEEGTYVSEGELLARLDTSLLQVKIVQAEASVAQALALAEQARDEANRVKSFNAGIMSDEQISARRFQARSAEAAVEVARAQLADLQTQKTKTNILAPVAGLVLERTVRPGDVSSLSQTMFRIAREGLIELDAEVPEYAQARIAIGDSATVTLASGTIIQGKVRLISPRVDPLTKLGRVRVQLPHNDDLRVGGYARAVFTDDPRPMAAVPEKAVQFEASGPRLVTIDDSNRTHFVAVKTGVRAAGYVAIEQGPPVGTRVVLGSGTSLLEGDVVAPVESAEPASAPASIPDKSAQAADESPESSAVHMEQSL